MNGHVVKAPECQNLAQRLRSPTYGILYVDDWTQITRRDGVALYGKKTGGDRPVAVDVESAELREKLMTLARQGAGPEGAEHDGAIFRFEVVFENN